MPENGWRKCVNITAIPVRMAKAETKIEDLEGRMTYYKADADKKDVTIALNAANIAAASVAMNNATVKMEEIPGQTKLMVNAATLKMVRVVGAIIGIFFGLAGLGALMFAWFNRP